MRKPFLVICLGISIILLFKFLPNPFSPPQNQAPQVKTDAERANDALQKLQKTIRKNYVDQLNHRFYYMGVDAEAFDEDSNTLVIKSDMLKVPMVRDQFVGRTFDIPYQEDLCAVGFTRLKVLSSIFLQDATVYGMQCKEQGKKKKSSRKSVDKP